MSTWTTRACFQQTLPSPPGPCPLHGEAAFGSTPLRAKGFDRVGRLGHRPSSVSLLGPNLSLERFPLCSSVVSVLKKCGMFRNGGVELPAPSPVLQRSCQDSEWQQTTQQTAHPARSAGVGVGSRHLYQGSSLTVQTEPPTELTRPIFNFVLDIACLSLIFVMSVFPLSPLMLSYHVMTNSIFRGGGFHILNHVFPHSLSLFIWSESYSFLKVNSKYNNP